MVRNGLFFRKNPLYERCPSCGEVNTIRKSRTRTFTERTIKKFTPWGLYRCKKCGWRGYRSKFVLTAQSLKNAVIYLFLVGIAALIVYEVLKRFV